MALVNCEECGKQISDKAESCPSCGAKPSKVDVNKTLDSSLRRNIFIGFFAVVMIFLVFKESKPPSETKPVEPVLSVEAQEAKKLRDAELAKQFFIVLRISSLREEMKNPASFELVEAINLKNGMLCVTYRATNSFGGVVTENKAISSEAKIVIYSANCSGKRGDDVTDLKRYLKKYE